MGLSRPRYNKAREAQLRAQRAGKTSKSDDHGADGNAETIIPKSAAEKAKERELRLLQEQVSGKSALPILKAEERLR